MKTFTKIMDVLCENTSLGDKVYLLKENDNLFEHGLDSFQMMRVIVGLERSLNFVFKDEDLLVVNFSTIESIVNSVNAITMNQTI
ncbi:phosphopantetheine-binding protein [Paenibacillus sp. M1]|uniref:Phosphopantetheine-binding protein n=1 Tax=Paenibacillus haidiansis TaxID=1574488 RepID=A0ABU7VQA8_9BACL